MDDTDDDDSEEVELQDFKTLKVTKALKVTIDIDLSMSAFSNARSYYDAKKLAGVKAEKTKISSKQAIIIAEKKINKTLVENKQKVPTITRIRNLQWFEKFSWFVTTENYLVISGKDDQQNDLLARRMVDGDVYVNCDSEGASAVIIKNIGKADSLISQTSLVQAGKMMN